MRFLSLFPLLLMLALYGCHKEPAHYVVSGWARHKITGKPFIHRRVFAYKENKKGFWAFDKFQRYRDVCQAETDESGYFELAYNEQDADFDWLILTMGGHPENSDYNLLCVPLNKSSQVEYRTGGYVRIDLQPQRTHQPKDITYLIHDSALFRIVGQRQGFLGGFLSNTDMGSVKWITNPPSGFDTLQSSAYPYYVSAYYSIPQDRDTVTVTVGY